MSTVIASECRGLRFVFNASSISGTFRSRRAPRGSAAVKEKLDKDRSRAMPLTRKLAAEFIGTFWLVLGGCGSAVLAAAFPHVGIGLVGVSLAFGLTIVAMAYAIGDVSGCHLNPAVTFGLVLGGRHPAKEMLPYWIVQVLGGIIAAWVLVFIAGGNGSDPLAGGLAANGFGDHSPGNYTMAAGFVCELVMTAVFLFVIMG